MNTKGALALGRQYPASPVVAVSALICDGDRILLIKRESEPARGQWSVPGGVLNLGESLKAGTAREVREETGLTVEVGEAAEVGENIVRDEQGRVLFHYVLIDYWARPVAGEAAAASDAAEVAWVDWNEAYNYPLTRATRAMLQRWEGDRPRWT